MLIGRFTRETFCCGLDIGAQSIKASIIKAKDNKDFQIIASHEIKTYGFKESSVTDLGELSECIRILLKELSKKAVLKPKEVHLGIGCDLVSSRKINTEIPLVDKGVKVITTRDVRKIKKNSRLLGVKIEEEILHDLYQSYTIDDTNEAINPIGLYGRKLGVTALIIYANINSIRNISKAVNQAGYDVSNILFDSYIAADVVLNDADKVEGSILIDIGSYKTCIQYFKNGILTGLKKINFGGNNFSQSISDQLNLPFDLAEDIKKSYAVALDSDLRNNEEILIKKDSVYMPIKKEIIYLSIDKILKDFISNIKEEINNFEPNFRISRGITMIGGGSLLPGLLERISLDTSVHARIGKIKLCADNKSNDLAKYSSVIGLAVNGFKKPESEYLNYDKKSTWAKTLSSKAREFYHEYF